VSAARRRRRRRAFLAALRAGPALVAVAERPPSPRAARARSSQHRAPAHPPASAPA
jgi:hypothetical protein